MSRVLDAIYSLIEELPESWDRVKPAVRHRDTGKIHMIRRGLTHDHIMAYLFHKVTGGSAGEDIESQRALYHWKDYDKYESGFYDPKKRSFHSREDPHSEYKSVDSTQFMGGLQRFKAYGSESSLSNMFNLDIERVPVIRSSFVR